MNLRTLTISAAIIAAGALSPAPAAEESAPAVGEGPRLMLSAKEINFGLVERDSELKGSVVITNSGTEPLVIFNISSGCSCARAGWKDRPLEPGASDTVSVSFDTHGRSAGEFQKMFRIRSNAEESLEVFFVKGKVKRSPFYND